MYDKTSDKISQMIKEGVFPCASFSFINKNQSVQNNMGYAQLMPTKEILKKDMLFDVASLTKVICTTTVILQLMEEGKIKLDQPLKKYYSSFSDDKITIRHLLTHTSDINSYIPNRDLLNQQELIGAYQKVRAGNEIGRKVVYTDSGTILLGFMLEELLNQSLVDIFRQRVLIPLEMLNSCFLPKDDSLIVPTENHPSRGLIRGKVHDPKANILAEHAGNAGLFTNLIDLEKFAQMYLNQGLVNGKSFLKSATIKELLKDQTPMGTGNRSFGWELKQDNDGNQFLFHTGYTGTFIIIDVINSEAFLFLSNRVHPNDHREAYIKKRNELIQIYFNEKLYAKR